MHLDILYATHTWWVNWTWILHKDVRCTSLHMVGERKTKKHAWSNKPLTRPLAISDQNRRSWPPGLDLVMTMIVEPLYEDSHTPWLVETQHLLSVSVQKKRISTYVGSFWGTLDCCNSICITAWQDPLYSIWAYYVKAHKHTRGLTKNQAPPCKTIVVITQAGRQAILYS